MENNETAMLPEILKSSFYGRLSGHWKDATSDAGAAWEIISKRTTTDRR
jgi:hypothetical protein